MDPIAHTLVGASLAQTGLRNQTSYATAALVIGANLPDLDALATFGGSDVSLWLRRGWTHGVPALVVLPIVLTAILLLWGRRRGATGLRPGVLLALSYLAVLTHPTLDWMNTYGMRWLMPFDGRWFYGDTLFIVDPWIWTALGGAIFLARERGWASVMMWTLFAGFAAFLLVIVVPGLWPAKVLWVGSIAALVWLRAARVGREPEAARRVAIGAVAAVTVYILALNVATRYARRQVLEAMAERGVVVERMMVGPVPVTPLVRDVVVQSPDGYYYGRARLVPEFELELAPRTIGKLPNTPVVAAAAASPSVRGFMNWARFPFAEVEKTPSGVTVYFGDARYTRSRDEGFGSARVELETHVLDDGGH